MKERDVHPPEEGEEAEASSPQLPVGPGQIVDLSDIHTGLGASGHVVVPKAGVHPGNELIVQPTYDMPSLRGTLERITGRASDASLRQLEWQNAVRLLCHDFDCWLEGLRLGGRVRIDRHVQVVHDRTIGEFNVEKRVYRFAGIDWPITVATLDVRTRQVILFPGMAFPPREPNVIFKLEAVEWDEDPPWLAAQQRLTPALFEAALEHVLEGVDADT